MENDFGRTKGETARAKSKHNEAQITVALK
jgi:hypothetical protein